MDKHTPGPWLLDDGFHAGLVEDDYHFIDAGRGLLSNGSGFGLSGVMSIHDARLIAAAPDLLEALKSIVEDHDFCGDDWGDRRDAWIETARAAIAKATGEAS